MQRATNVNSHALAEYGRMLSFVARWAPFDHGDEYILPEFGIAPSTFYRRVLAFVQKHHPRRCANPIVNVCSESVRRNSPNSAFPIKLTRPVTRSALDHRGRMPSHT